MTKSCIKITAQVKNLELSLQASEGQIGGVAVRWLHRRSEVRAWEPGTI